MANFLDLSGLTHFWGTIKSYVDKKIAALVNSAPETMDTLGELAAVLDENQDAVDVLNEAIGTRALTSDLTAHTDDTTVHVTSGERTNWNAAKSHADTAHAPSTAQANVIETVQVNGTALTPNSKAVNVTVPTKVSQLTNDSGFKTTDTNTTYTLTKSGSTITLTGSDGSKTSVTDAIGEEVSIVTYTLTKSGSTITLTGSDGSKTSVTDSDTNTTYSAITNAQIDAIFE